MNGFIMIGIPESMSELIKSISEKTGLSMTDVISESIKKHALILEEKKQIDEKIVSSKKIRFER